jgi:hypothetical protein
MQGHEFPRIAMIIVTIMIYGINSEVADLGDLLFMISVQHCVSVVTDKQHNYGQCPTECCHEEYFNLQ